MLLNSPYSVHQNNKNKWIVKVNNRYFQVNYDTIILLKCLKKSSTYKDAYHLFLKEDLALMSFSDFKVLADSKINALKFLDLNNNNIREHNYLKFKVNLISEKNAAYVGLVFSPLFYPSLFVFFFTFSIIFHCFFTMPELVELDFSFNLTSSGGYLLLLFLPVFFHEVGHISACSRFKARHQGIGVGFYFIFPVAYSDVTDIWMLPKYQRQIVNLAGVFMEVQYALIIGVIALLISDVILMQVSAFLFLLSFLPLNPLMRHDGYWIICDWADIPNLMSESSLALKKTLNFVFLDKGENYILTKRNFFLSCYALLNLSALFFVLIFMYNYNAESILNFPVDLFYFLKGIFKGYFDFGFIDLNGLIAFVFYVFLIRFLLTSPQLIKKLKSFYG